MSVLDKIVANRRREIKHLKRENPLEGFINDLENLPPSEFKTILENNDRVNIIKTRAIAIKMAAILHLYNKHKNIFMIIIIVPVMEFFCLDCAESALYVFT